MVASGAIFGINQTPILISSKDGWMSQTTKWEVNYMLNFQRLDFALLKIAKNS
jgi:hypothetical protein